MQPNRLVRTIVTLAVLAAAGGAQSSSTARAPLTERQRDSVIAQSGLPAPDVGARATPATEAAAPREGWGAGAESDSARADPGGAARSPSNQMFEMRFVVWAPNPANGVMPSAVEIVAPRS